MSSRHDYRRRDRSWERDERDRDRGGHRGGRRSRSRSPLRRVDRDRRSVPGALPPPPIRAFCNRFMYAGCIADRRDYYTRDREDDRQDTRRDDRWDDRRDDRRRDDRDQRDHDRDRDDKREPPPPSRGANRNRHDKDRDGRQADRVSEHDTKPAAARDRQHIGMDIRLVAHDRRKLDCLSDTPERSNSRPRQASETVTDGTEEGEEMDATNDDDAAMMGMMGLSGFGTTKVRLSSSRSAYSSLGASMCNTTLSRASTSKAIRKAR